MRKDFFIPFKYKISIIMVAIAILIVSFLGVVHYNNLKGVLVKEYEEKVQLLTDKTVDAYMAMDLTYSVLEKSLEDRMRKVSLSIVNDFANMKGGEEINLFTYKNAIKGMEIALINGQYVTEKTTSKENLNKDYRLWPEGLNRLKYAKFNNTFASDRIGLTASDSKMKKISYEPTVNGQYVVEIAVDMHAYASVYKNIDFNTIAQDLIIANSSISNVTLYNSSGRAYGRTDRVVPAEGVSEKLFMHINDVIKQQSIIEVYDLYNENPALYKYIPILPFGTTNTDSANVIEVIFNDHELQKNLRTYSQITLTSTLLIIILVVFVGTMLSNRVSSPIHKMMQVINAVSNGDFTGRTEIASTDEFKVLSKNFDRMIEEIAMLIDERDLHVNVLNEKNAEIVYQRDEINALYEETTAMNSELEGLLAEVKKSYLNTVQSLANAIEAKDQYTRGHCERVTEYSVAIGNAMGLGDDDVYNLRLAGILHDIGKIGIDSNILNKAGKLTDEEFAQIQRHPVIGYNILKGIEFLEKCREIIYQHHERVDGTGYPLGLKDSQIGILSKIVAVADAYDAMTSERPYRSTPLTREAAILQLEENKGTQFDGDVVEVFSQLIKENTQ